MVRLLVENGHGSRPSAFSNVALPALDSLTSPGGDKEKAAFILRLLRQAALKSRAKKSLPFYSIRSVARHFGVPATTVTRIYRQLRDEGVLTSIWGSKTFIEPTSLDKELHVKAIVGLPASVRDFSTTRNYRTFLTSMSDELWRHGFATRFLFYETNGSTPNSVELLLKYKIDVLVWLLPNSKIPNIGKCFLDRGIRLVTIIDSLPKNGECGYFLSRRNALQEGLSTWKRNGVRSATIIHQSGSDSLSKLRLIEGCLREAGMSYKIADSASSSSLSKSLPPLRRESGIIFTSSESLLRAASEGITKFLKFLRPNRVMLVEGAVDFPIGAPLNGSVDVVEFDWATITKRIGNDIADPERFPTHQSMVFEAKWRGNPVLQLSEGGQTFHLLTRK